MPLQSPDNVVGIKHGVILFGFLGSALSLSYAKEMTPFQAVIAVVTGMAVSVMANPLVLHYLTLADEFDRAIAFFAGLFAMRAVPVAFALIDRLRDAKFPWLSGPKE